MGWRIVGLNPGHNKNLSSFQNCPDTIWDPPSNPLNGQGGAHNAGVKQWRCEAAHSPPPTAEVKNEWS